MKQGTRVSVGRTLEKAMSCTDCGLMAESWHALFRVDAVREWGAGRVRKVMHTISAGVALEDLSWCVRDDHKAKRKCHFEQTRPEGEKKRSKHGRLHFDACDKKTWRENTGMNRGGLSAQ